MIATVACCLMAPNAILQAGDQAKVCSSGFLFRSCGVLTLTEGMLSCMWCFPCRRAGGGIRSGLPLASSRQQRRHPSFTAHSYI
jgi:hypothetical protein